MSAIDQLLANNRTYQSEGPYVFAGGAPAKKLAIVSCMDARLDMYRILGLEEGDAHVIRNAGGVVTDDVLRSLVISQRFLGTEEIVLIHHTQCGMLTFRDDDVRAEIAAETGQKPLFALQAFASLEDDIREGMQRIRTSPFLKHRTVRGFVLDVGSGALNEVDPA